MKLVKGRAHVLGGALWRHPSSNTHNITCLNSLHAFAIKLELSDGFVQNYETDSLFGPVHGALRYSLQTGDVQRDCTTMIMPLFTVKKKVLLYAGKVCVPRASVKDILRLAHDVRSSGHLSTTKILSLLGGFHWKNKSRDVEQYSYGCRTCPQFKHGRHKPLGTPQPLEPPERRWGSICKDFITHLPQTDSGFDSTTAFVDQFSKHVRLFPSCSQDTAQDVASCFFDNLFRVNGLLYSIISDHHPKFTANFWKQLMLLCDFRLRMSSSRHPQTNGVTEILNRIVGK